MSSSGMHDLGDLVHRFLGSIGRPREAEFYLSLFRSGAPGTFAVIAVSDSVVREGAGALAADLTFLDQLGLRPLVALGVGGGGAALELATTLEQRLAHIPARVAAPHQAAQVSRGGELALVPFADAGAAVSARFDSLRDLVTELGSRKLVFVGRRSGLQSEDGAVWSLVSLQTDYPQLAAPGVLPPAQRVLLGEVKRLMEATPQPLTTSITSPLDLLRELFTMKGAGTLIRRGSQVDRHGDLSQVDLPRLRALVERAFGKTADSELWQRPLRALFLEREYRSAALVSPAPVGAYLSKFAVDTAAQGEGLGSDLWRELIADEPQLVWRCRPDNAIAGWYRQVCDGMSKSAKWHVFWLGLPVETIPEAVDFALRAPVDFG